MLDAHHKSVSSLLTLSFLWLWVAVLDEEALVQILKDIVKEWDHLYREVNELIVKLSIIVLEVSALNFKDGSFE